MSLPPTKTFHGLDHLRCLAITLVFLFHYQLNYYSHPEWLPDFISFGWTGVDLFFVLSGFLIASQLFEQIKKDGSISLKLFFTKRFFRILPAYWLVVIVYFLFIGFHEKEALSPLWKFLTFTTNFGMNTRDFGTFSHAWSLCVEEHFYFLLPLVISALTFFRKLHRGYWILIALFIAGFFIRSAAHIYQYMPVQAEQGSWMYWYKYVYYPTYNRLDGLIVGVSIAALYRFRPNAWNKISAFGNLWILGGLAILTAGYFITEDAHSYEASVYGFPVVALGFGCVVIGAISPSSLLYKWKSRVAAHIATLSFAVYLSHKGIIHLTQYVMSQFNLDITSNWAMGVCALSCIAVAWAMYLVVEKPMLRLRESIVSKWTNDTQKI
jgi:peptidoglycan/LPS O-acetylase OafA/YrhL